MPVLNERQSTFLTALEIERRVLVAVMLRNMRTRFFGHGLGHLVSIGWPVSHLIVLVGLWTVAGRAPPFGDSAVLFLATGVLQFMTFSYLSRFMMISLLHTKPLLAFPEVKALDVLFASAVLECLSACAVIVVMLVLGWFLNINIWPHDLVQAFYAVGAAILLGLGLGMFNGVVMLAFPQWLTWYTLTVIASWAFSGVLFVPSLMPEPLRTVISYNPTCQLVEWMRAAFFEGYGEGVLDRTYALSFGAIALALGLALERLIRGPILANR
jgi:capsular polysaccharide transport system permease protein